MSTNRRKFSKDFKAKVVLEALKEREPLEVLAKMYELTPTRISTWKALVLENFGNVFSTDPSETKKDGIEEQILYAQIGQLKVENDWLKKKLR